MDLSAVIFVALALAWAVYLIPKALKHHDEMASDRLIEGHSDKVRILSRHGRAAKAQVASTREEARVDVRTRHRRPVLPFVVRQVGRPPSVAVASSVVLLLAVAVVAGLAWFAIVPWWSTAIPGGMVVLFLVVARLSVRKANRRRRIAAARRVVEQDEMVECRGLSQWSSLSKPVLRLLPRSWSSG